MLAGDEIRQVRGREKKVVTAELHLVSDNCRHEVVPILSFLGQLENIVKQILPLLFLPAIESLIAWYAENPVSE